jgi:hypothetical protein
LVSGNPRSSRSCPSDIQSGAAMGLLDPPSVGSTRWRGTGLRAYLRYFVSSYPFVLWCYRTWCGPLACPRRRTVCLFSGFALPRLLAPAGGTRPCGGVSYRAAARASRSASRCAANLVLRAIGRRFAHTPAVPSRTPGRALAIRHLARPWHTGRLHHPVTGETTSKGRSSPSALRSISGSSPCRRRRWTRS